MGITVKLEDGMVEVGGNFQSALSFVKAFNGRKYDPSTKSWTIPKTVKDFTSKCMNRFPVDILSGNHGNPRISSGNHITKYGNAYSHDEWSAFQKSNEVEREIHSRYIEQYHALESDQVARYVAAGVPENYARRIAGKSLEDLEETGAVKFSSPERREKMMVIDDWYWNEWQKLSQAEDDETEVARMQIYDAYGVY